MARWKKDPNDTRCKANTIGERHSPFVDDEGRCEWCGKRINTPGYGDELTIPEALLDYRTNQRFGFEQRRMGFRASEQLIDCEGCRQPLTECECE